MRKSSLETLGLFQLGRAYDKSNSLATLVYVMIDAAVIAVDNCRSYALRALTVEKKLIHGNRNLISIIYFLGVVCERDASGKHWSGGWPGFLSGSRELAQLPGAWRNCPEKKGEAGIGFAPELLLSGA